MCDGRSAVGKITQPIFGGPPSSDEAMERGEGSQAASQAYYDELAREGKIAFGKAQEEYEAQAPLRQQQIEEATITPEKIAAARTRSMADVASAYQGARAANTRALTAQGINPGDPAAQAGSNAGAVNLAAAQTGAGNTAALSERAYRTSLAAGVTGRQAPTMSMGMSGLSGAGQGYAGIAGQNYQLANSQQQQQTSLIPSFSIKKGGRVLRGGFRPMTMRTAGGQVRPTSAGPAEGHIDGPGSGTSDDVDAKLSRGEYVVTEKATSQLHPRTLDALTEIGHKAAAKDPSAQAHLRKVVATIHAGGFRAPERIAGQEPRMSRAPSADQRSVGSKRGGFRLGYQDGGTIRSSVSGQAPHAKGGGKLDAAKRNALPTSTFGLPGERKYPMPDRSHAANAKARATQQVKRGNLSASKKAQIDAKANRMLGAAAGGFRKSGGHVHRIPGGKITGPPVDPKTKKVWADDGGAVDQPEIAPYRKKGSGISLNPMLQPGKGVRRGGRVRADGGGYLDQTDVNVVPGMNAEESVAGYKAQQAKAAAGSPPLASASPGVQIGGYGDNSSGGGQGKNRISVRDVMKAIAAAGAAGG